MKSEKKIGTAPFIQAYTPEKRDEADMLERAFIQVIVDRVEEMGVKYKAFATQVWPELSSASAQGKFNEMRKYSYKTGKPQRISISAAARMAAFFGEDLAYLLSVAKEQVKRNIYKNQTLKD